LPAGKALATLLASAPCLHLLRPTLPGAGKGYRCWQGAGRSSLPKTEDRLDKSYIKAAMPVVVEDRQLQ